MNRQREKRSVIHKVGNAAGIVLSGILIFILSMNCILIFKSLTNMEKVPGIGGIIPMIVLTNSMYPREFDSWIIEIGLAGRIKPAFFVSTF